MYMIGVLSYFMVKLSRGSGRPSGHALALEIISGAAVVYASSMLLLSICLLQKHFFQFFTILMDLLFMGGFIAIAILLRSAPHQNCSSSRTTTPNPQWLGNVGGRPSIHCKLIEGLFGCAVGLAVLFFLTLFPALLAMRSKKETTYHDDTPKQRGFIGFGREKRVNDTALPTRALVAPIEERPSADTAFTKDTEKGSDVGLGREYNRGYTATNSQTAGLAPAAVPPVRTVSPLQSELYNNNNNTNHMTTTRGTSYQSNNEMNNTATYQGVHNDTYDNVSRSSELPTNTHNNVYNGNNLEEVDPNVGGVTGNIYKMHMNRINN